MTHTTTLCRRRWARCGRGLADFAFGFALAGLSHVLVNFWKLNVWAWQRMRGAFRRKAGRRSVPASSSLQRETQRLIAAERPAGVAAFSPVAEKPNVRFSDVAGLDEAKRDIMLRMVLPLQYPDKARALGVRRGGGLLLYGPPGTGKTLLAKAVATELDCPFYHARPSDIMSGQVGEAERNVQKLFAAVRAHERAVLFLDEVEALVPSRRRNGSTIMARVISQFLSEVDGLGSSQGATSLLLIGATNEPDMLDSAMLRPGRFDTKVYVGPPDPAAREQILRLCLNDRPASEDVFIPELVQMTEGKTGAEIRCFVQQAADHAFLRSIQSSIHATPVFAMADFTMSVSPTPESYRRGNTVSERPATRDKL